ncbi:MAG: winged helix-turn-helix transcriptional regulator [Nanoarchaeota archaeon]|nr:winged helix-turn-helix transcriptional regulator [Nanoarchaeota archaeon]
MGLLDRILGRTKQKRKPKKKKVKKKAKKKVPEEVLETVETVSEKPVLSDLKDTKALLKNWDQQVKTIQDHPLSQAKIINTQLLARLTEVLKSMDERLEQLVKLDEILDLLNKSKEEIADKGVISENLDKAIRQLQLISIKDKEVIEVLQKKGKLTADQMSNEIKVTRSTCSSRLNRLYTLGLLDKEAVGKRIFYKIKKD